MAAAASYPDLVDAGVFITGGATGIGAAFVEAFVAQGSRVVFNDLDTVSGSRLVAELGDRCHFVVCDASDPAALRSSIEEGERLVGSLDVLVNNVANDRRETFDTITPESWRTGFAVNLEPVVFASQAVLPAMAERGSGSIVNLSSLNAFLGPADLPTYTAAKAGMLGLTRTMARQYGPDGVRVNAIVPGWVATERQRRLWLSPGAEAAWKDQCALKGDLLPDDVANLALFLASSVSKMITGQALVIDAGRI
ncbi:MAG: SDR family oxidoreductase [Pseudomonadota bacterium]